VVKIPYVNLEVSLTKYWDGQPVRFTLRKRDNSVEYFRLEFILVEDDVEELVDEPEDVADCLESVENLQDEID